MLEMKARLCRHLISFIVIFICWFKTTTAWNYHSPIENIIFLRGAASTNRSGLTGDSCESSFDCTSPRTCIDTDGNGCSSSSSSCVCVPSSGLQTCTASTECVHGEGCVDLSGNQYCVSCDYAEKFSVSIIDDTSTCSVTEDDSEFEESTPEPSSGTGLTGDTCSFDSDCVSPRECVDQDGVCSYVSSSCFCIPPSGTQTCTASTECVYGEGCADLSGTQICVSCEFVRSSDTAYFIDDVPSCPVDEDDDDFGESSPEPSSGTGLTGDPCILDSDCASPRKCYDNGDDFCSYSTLNCICIPVSGAQTCVASTDCVYGEGCADFSGDRYCVSCEYVRLSTTAYFVDEVSACPDIESDNEVGYSPAPDVDDESSEGEDTDVDEDTDSDGSEDASPTEPIICVSAVHLKHLKDSELVFTEHRRSSVLCDSHESCATPGHIVVYQSHAMTMSRYCNTFSKSCHRRVMYVNSPRMQYGLRISSFTEGLEFTPLAAKYETRLEEAVLKTLVHLGM